MPIFTAFVSARISLSSPSVSTMASQSVVLASTPVPCQKFTRRRAACQQRALPPIFCRGRNDTDFLYAIFLIGGRAASSALEFRLLFISQGHAGHTWVAAAVDGAATYRRAVSAAILRLTCDLTRVRSADSGNFIAGSQQTNFFNARFLADGVLSQHDLYATGHHFDIFSATVHSFKSSRLLLAFSDTPSGRLDGSTKIAFSCIHRSYRPTRQSSPPAYYSDVTLCPR